MNKTKKVYKCLGGKLHQYVCYSDLFVIRRTETSGGTSVFAEPEPYDAYTFFDTPKEAIESALFGEMDLIQHWHMKLKQSADIRDNLIKLLEHYEPSMKG